jgi:hypothetical protein
VDRFFIISVPALFLLSAQGLKAVIWRTSESSQPLQSKLSQPGPWVGLALVILMLWGSYRMYLSPIKLKKENWRATAAYLNVNARPNDMILLRTFQTSVPFNYYTVESAPVEVLETNRVVQPLEEIAKGADRIWLVYWNSSSDAHLLAQQAVFDLEDEPLLELQEILDDQNVTSERKTDFQGTTIFLLPQQ